MIAERPRLRRLPAPPRLSVVFRRGAPRRSGPLTVWLLPTALGRRRAAVAVRSLGVRLKSHDRHRALRRLREAVRLEQAALPPSVDAVCMVTYAPPNLPSYQEIVTALRACLRSRTPNASR